MSSLFSWLGRAFSIPPHAPIDSSCRPHTPNRTNQENTAEIKRNESKEHKNVFQHSIHEDSYDFMDSSVRVPVTGTRVGTQEGSWKGEMNQQGKNKSMGRSQINQKIKARKFSANVDEMEIDGVEDGVRLKKPRRSIKNVQKREENECGGNENVFNQWNKDAFMDIEPNLYACFVCSCFMQSEKKGDGRNVYAKKHKKGKKIS